MTLLPPPPRRRSLRPGRALSSLANREPMRPTGLRQRIHQNQESGSNDVQEEVHAAAVPVPVLPVDQSGHLNSAVWGGGDGYPTWRGGKGKRTNTVKSQRCALRRYVKGFDVPCDHFGAMAGRVTLGSASRVKDNDRNHCPVPFHQGHNQCLPRNVRMAAIHVDCLPGSQSPSTASQSPTHMECTSESEQS
jgi:hypothetical protein